VVAAVGVMARAKGEFSEVVKKKSGGGWRWMAAHGRRVAEVPGGTGILSEKPMLPFRYANDRSCVSWFPWSVSGLSFQSSPFHLLLFPTAFKSHVSTFILPIFPSTLWVHQPSTINNQP
jgi:hypothetical protein